MIETACKLDKPVRIGVNWGSLDQELLAKKLDINNKLKKPKILDDVMCEVVIDSALESAKLAELIGISKDKIIKDNAIRILDSAYSGILRMVRSDDDYETINLIQPILDKIDEIQNEIEELWVKIV